MLALLIWCSPHVNWNDSQSSQSSINVVNCSNFDIFFYIHPSNISSIISLNRVPIILHCVSIDISSNVWFILYVIRTILVSSKEDVITFATNSSICVSFPTPLPLLHSLVVRTTADVTTWITFGRQLYCKSTDIWTWCGEIFYWSSTFNLQMLSDTVVSSPQVYFNSDYWCLLLTTSNEKVSFNIMIFFSKWF